MTVLVYINTSKQVGDAEHIKVFASEDAAEVWFEENDPKAWPSNMRSSSGRCSVRFRRDLLAKASELGGQILIAFSAARFPLGIRLIRSRRLDGVTRLRR